MSMISGASPIDLNGIQVKSFIPGRLRLVFSPAILREIRPYTGLLVDLGFASSVSVNDAVNSMVIHYDSAKFGQSEFIETVLATVGFEPDDIAVFTETLSARAADSLSPFGGLFAPESRVSTGPVPAGGWTVKSDVPGRLRAHHPLLQTRQLLVQTVESGLMGMDGVTSYSVTPSVATVLVHYDPSAVGRERVLAILVKAVDLVVGRAADEGDLPTIELDRTTLQLSLSTVSMALAVASFVVPALRVAALVTTAVASTHIVVSAAKAIAVERKIKVDVLDATVITLALWYRHVLPAGLMVWVVDVSNVLLDASSKAQKRTLSEIFGRQVRKTWRLTDGAEIECSVADLQKGDVIVVRSGEQIPVDGVILAGDAMIDQSALTGEHVPAEMTVDSRVMAMTVVQTGKVHIQVNETGEETNAARMVKLIEQSFEHQVYLQSLTETFADVMVVPTLSLGGLGYAISGPGAMMAVINADFGTGIRIAGPLAMLSSLSVAARNGILIKKGSVLERIAGMDAIVFDKTGTLTEEVPRVAEVISLDDAFDENAVLAHVAAAEQRFNHPIAKAILAEAAERGLELPPTEESEYRMGFGVHVRIGGEDFKVGSRRYMEGEGIRVSAAAGRRIKKVHADGGSAIFAAAGNRLVGLIELKARPRAEAREVIRTLREKRGITEIYLISGDHEAPTRALAQDLGIEHYFAEVLPQDKARHVKALQERGLKVAMVGDGINDTVGLSQADYSVSLRGAAEAATDIADVVLMDGNLAKLDLLFEISENLDRNVRRSFMLAVVPNSICIAGALMGYFGLGASLILNNAFNLVATGNGVRAQAPLHDRLRRQARLEAAAISALAAAPVAGVH